MFSISTSPYPPFLAMTEEKERKVRQHNPFLYLLQVSKEEDQKNIINFFNKIKTTPKDMETLTGRVKIIMLTNPLNIINKDLKLLKRELKLLQDRFALITNEDTPEIPIFRKSIRDTKSEILSLKNKINDLENKKNSMILSKEPTVSILKSAWQVSKAIGSFLWN